MYLYLLEFESFIKIGITKNLINRVTTHKSNYNEKINESKSIYWKADSHYILFMEEHIKRTFTLNISKLKASGHTEIFNHVDKMEIVNVINSFFRLLSVTVETDTLSKYKQKRNSEYFKYNPENMIIKTVINMLNEHEFSYTIGNDLKHIDGRFNIDIEFKNIKTKSKKAIVKTNGELVGSFRNNKISLHGEMVTGVPRSTIYNELKKRGK